MQIFGLSDIGKKRETNEDHFGIVGFSSVAQTSALRGAKVDDISNLDAGESGSAVGVAAVADGMGGHKAGEVASGETIKLICDELQPYIGKDLTAQNIEVLMVSAIKNANSLIRKMASEVPTQAGMGTTIVIAYVTEDTAYIANVGDSRAYIVNDAITQITRDHSLVEDLIDDGTITRDAAKTHPRKHVITRAIGTDDNILADIFEYKYQAGRDTLILCSDGLTEMLDDNEIFEIVSNCDDIKVGIENLVNKANELGGVDNITVVGLKF